MFGFDVAKSIKAESFCCSSRANLRYLYWEYIWQPSVSRIWVADLNQRNIVIFCLTSSCHVMLYLSHDTNFSAYKFVQTSISTRPVHKELLNLTAVYQACISVCNHGQSTAQYFGQHWPVFLSSIISSKSGGSSGATAAVVLVVVAVVITVMANSNSASHEFVGAQCGLHVLDPIRFNKFVFLAKLQTWQWYQHIHFCIMHRQRSEISITYVPGF